jgi:hypothetical protein
VSITRSIAALTTAALLAVAPAALAVGPPAHPGAAHKPAGTPTRPANPGTDHSTQASDRGTDDAGAPGPDAPTGVKAKAYGRFCQGQSKKHVEGEKGTAFSRCVTALAKAATGNASPKEACAGLSHKHTAGRHGTPYSRCVVAARHLADQPA